VTTTAADTWVGQRLRRKEDARLVRGAGRFTPDIVVPGALHAAVLRSPFAHALKARRVSKETTLAPACCKRRGHSHGIPDSSFRHPEPARANRSGSSQLFKAFNHVNISNPL